MLQHSRSQVLDSVDVLLSTLGDSVDFSAWDLSLAPHYSDVGLCFEDGVPGVSTLCYHYNRKTIRVDRPFFHFITGTDVSAATLSSTPLGVTQMLGDATLSHAFYTRNSWLVSTSGLSSLRFDPLAHEPAPRELRTSPTPDGRTFLYHFLLPTLDKRDPDPTFPVVLGIRLLHGQCRSGLDLPAGLDFLPASDGRILLAVTMNLLDTLDRDVRARLDEAPADIPAAGAATRRWLSDALGPFDGLHGDARELPVLSRAVLTLLFNSTEAPGLFAGRIASFPNRGIYPCHFQWDACFQNLALDRMSPRLAEDALYCLTETLRSDGKFGSFLCSTWMRAGESQPPLVGWAGLRLVRERNDDHLAARLLGPLARNTEWWLSQRMSRFGLVFCTHAVETGWDDTPRFDKGLIVPTDMNAYLLMQMRAIVEMAGRVGETALADEYAQKADAFAQRIVACMFDPATERFHDLLLATGERIPTRTPAMFLPFLAGALPDEDRVRRILATQLLDPSAFYGEYPFPCVAYDDPDFDPAHWWRGPVWLPVAYLCLELLAKYGFHAERREAARRLYRCVIQDGRLCELFDARTGQGMGSRQQGWTAAIALRLKMEYPDFTGD